LIKSLFNKVIDFIKNYADKFYHVKEEGILFKEFNKCTEEGCVHCNPVEQMLVEHYITKCQGNYEYFNRKRAFRFRNQVSLKSF